MSITIQVRRDTAANWVSANPVLHQGEPGLETDTGRFKYGDGSTAWNSLAYTLLPLAQMDARYANVFSPMAYGAVGNGTANDTTAVLAANTAAAAAKGIVDFGTYTFKTSSAIPLASSVTYRGSASGGGGITNSASDIFSVTGTVQGFTIRDCTLTASGGHVFNCATSSLVSLGTILNCSITQSSASHGIWYMPSGTYIDMTVGDGCSLVASGTATVIPWYVAGQANSCRWRSMRVTANGTSATVPFFQIECDSADAWSSSNSFRDITVEGCVAGFIYGLTVDHVSIENVCGYDVTTYNDSLFSFSAGTGGLRSQNITIRNSGRVNGALGSGAYDVYCAGATQAILIENVGSETLGSSYSVPSAYATIIGGVGGNSTVQSNVIAATGTLTVAGSDPLQPWMASDSGWLAYAYDPVLIISNSTSLSGGAIYLIRVNVRIAMSVTNVIIFVSTVGSSLTTSENYSGLYNSAGALIAATADQTSAWEANANTFHPMALSGGPYNLTPGFYWVAILSNGSTPPKIGYIESFQAAAANPGLTIATARFAANGTGTTLPSTITPANNTMSSFTPWAGLS